MKRRKIIVCVILLFVCFLGYRFGLSSCKNYESDSKTQVRENCESYTGVIVDKFIKTYNGDDDVDDDFCLIIYLDDKSVIKNTDKDYFVNGANMTDKTICYLTSYKFYHSVDTYDEIELWYADGEWGRTILMNRLSASNSMFVLWAGFTVLCICGAFLSAIRLFSLIVS